MYIFPGAPGFQPKSERNSGATWSKEEIKEFKTLAEQNIPTRIIGLKFGRTVSSVRDKAKSQKNSLKPSNRSPYSVQAGKKGEKSKRPAKKSS